jgi:hypothetical protein
MRSTYSSTPKSLKKPETGTLGPWWKNQVDRGCISVRLLLRLTPYVEDEARREPSACRTKDLAYIGGQA